MRWCALALVLLAAASPAGAAEAPGLYARKADWAQTMLAAREAYARHLAEDARRSAVPQAKPFVSELIYGDGPGQALSLDVAGQRTLRLTTTLEQGVGNCTIWGEARLVAKDGSETPLSRLDPVSVRVGWGQLYRDRNWEGRPLQIGSRQFAHGIWVHTDSDVCYALDGRYERFEAWFGIDHARATGAARFRVLFTAGDPIPAVWAQVARDFPAEAAWLESDARDGRHLTWFYEGASTRLDQELIGRALGQAGEPGAALQAELEQLRQSQAAPADPRWLELYSRACRLRECANAVRGVEVAEVRSALMAQLAGLARGGVSPGDARWRGFEERAAKLHAAFPPARDLSVADLSRSAEILSGALPRRFGAGDPLRARLSAWEQRWGETLPSLAQGEEPALRKAAALYQEGQQLRRSLLLAMGGTEGLLAAAAPVDLVAEWESQFAALQHDLRNRGHFARVAGETYHREALIVDADRDPAGVVLRRTAALLADLERTSSRASLAPLRDELRELQAASARIPLGNIEARYLLFALACKVRRQIAFRNPLASFDRLLFVKRHRSLFNHMCDQYYGMAARPGGGLHVLSRPFGPNPVVTDVLAHSVVANGRLKGQRLSGGPDQAVTLAFDGMGNLQGDPTEGGSFLSPDLSYDGRSVLFAYVECRGDRLHRHHTDPTRGHWAEGRCYHVFRVGVDGSGLTQLTDGTWNDFDPCWLPNGRIAFISERRGGYLRCGRVCPTYTLFDMAADGRGVNCLSFHETNEWHPSVTHDGRIIYTRWDYVDRHGCTAHLPWITTLDGRDSRAVHGNFAPRQLRPDMELDVRAIPGSRKFMATAAPHHGQAFGSLVVIDPEVQDDDAMAPVKRFTPEVGFPESQGGPEAYGTAWPLSQDYALCVYDADVARYRPGAAGNYGIYLVDSFGNKELLYRDPGIACQSPIPVRPRTSPARVPVLAAQDPLQTNPATRPKAPARRQPAEATVAVVNVYDSRMPWPKGTRIEALRVIQILPMTVPSGMHPHETGLRAALAADSVVPARAVLGTVPVEADGSAYFRIPANKEVFFQALDQRGLAVQSMRSATYARRGERLVCQGCHGNQPRSPRADQGMPLALRRAPSRLRPDMDGSNPFSYPRLVQPVLDRHCASCHAQHPGQAPNLGREPIQQKWYASYASLVTRYAFTDYGSGYRTTPGQFGARASKLLALLDAGHHGLVLPREDYHRIALWLDCLSMFYGVYEKEGGEAQLRGEVARPTLE